MNEPDYRSVKTKFERSIATYDEHATAQRMIVSRLAGLVDRLYKGNPSRILEVGCGTGLLTREISLRFSPEQYYLNDINEKIKEFIPESSCYSFLPGDARRLVFPSNIDLFVSTSAIQWFSDPFLFFETMQPRMSSGGYLFFSTFGKSNLREIRELEGAGLQYYDKGRLMSGLSSLFRVFYAEEETITLTFESPLAVLSHLKLTGVNGGFATAWNKSKLIRFCEEYRSRFSFNTGVSLTFNPIYVGMKMFNT